MRLSVACSSAIAISDKELRRYYASPMGYTLMIGAGILFGLAVTVREPASLLGPVARLTFFSPSSEFAGHSRFTLLVGMTRLVVLVLVPMISMRLFVEERRSRTIEMLFTSPIREEEIVLGKWAGAMVLYLAILAVSAIEIALFRWSEFDSLLALSAYGALISPGAALLAIGEAMSTFTRHESVAAFWTLVVSFLQWAWCHSGVMSPLDFAACLVLAAAGWIATWRSLRALRWAY